MSKKLDSTKLRELLFPEDTVEEQARIAKKQKAIDTWGAAWAFDGVQCHYQYSKGGAVYSQRWFRMPAAKVYLLAIARLEQEGVLATTNHIQELVGLSHQVVSRTLRWMCGNLSPWWRDKVTLQEGEQWPLGRVKHGRSYIYYVIQPGEETRSDA